MLRGVSKPANQWHQIRNHRLFAPVTSLIIFITFLVFVSGRMRQQPGSISNLPNLKRYSYSSSVELRPTVEYRSGTDVIWQIPKSAKAVLFLAHGCNGRAMNFWDKSPECPKCVGLPEERLITLNALSRKFAVLAISSVGECWSLGEERNAVKEIIRWWIRKHKLDTLPLTALGASSGGYFVSALAMDMKFNSIVSMIAEGVFHRFKIPDAYPPTLFVHMPKDSSRLQLVRKNIESLREKGVDVAEIECMEFPLTPSLLSDRIPEVNASLSVQLFELFRKNGVIDERGYMVKDGRATRWKDTLKDEKVPFLVQNDLFHHIQEELNLAYAYHEMTSLQMDQILEWFESHMK
ncbi:hypothetical protein Syun_002091 [Stephania yunnanensis]|uniref:Uncharacterized protein n=1 Tax=Stephania yunnanensis TaxID=152371 RepID=A0AAP0LF92_9MAGN